MGETRTPAEEGVDAFDESVLTKVLGEPWSYADANTQQWTHNLHRYSGKFIPQIARRAIEILSKPGDIILDPYCGSGTVLVESALSRRRALGVDLSPLAVLIAATKIKPVSRGLRNSLLERMYQTVDSLEGGLSLNLGPSSTTHISASIRQDPRLQDEWFQKWFGPDVLQDLVYLDLAIQQIEDVRLKAIGRVAFSDILRKSSHAHSGYPNVMFDKRLPIRARPGRSFIRALERTCEMVGSLERSSAVWEDCAVVCGNATALPIGDETIDAIITHPPYIGSIPYAEYGLLSIKWLGEDPKKLDLALTGGRRQSRDVVTRFEAGYSAALRECWRVLKPGRFLFAMVGNPTVRGEVIDLANMSVEFAQSAGLDLVARTTREGSNRRANKMGSEHLLFFRKRG